MDKTLKPLDLIKKIVFNWKVLFLFMLVGAGAGELAHYLYPPIFESHASLSVNIDYTRTGLLTDIEEDQVLGMIGDLITSPELITVVLQTINSEEGIDLDEAGLRGTASLERDHEKFVIRIHHTDPRISAYIANTWINLVNERLLDAHGHAVIAANYQKYLDSLESCLENSVVIDPATPFCSIQGVTQLQNELDVLGKAILYEKKLGKGISPAIGFQISAYAQPASRPVRHARGTLILAGSTLGFIICLCIIKIKSANQIQDKPIP